MNAEAPARSHIRIGAVLAVVALVAVVLSGAASLLAGPSYRGGVLALGVAIQTVRWATICAMVATVVALIAMLLVAFPASVARRRWLPVAATALVLSILVAAPPLHMYRQSARVPAIHDVTTDTVDPPKFVAVVPLRKNARNPVEYKAETGAKQNKGYPDIAPVKLALPPAEAFERAERVARSMGWEIVAVVPQDLRIEATDTTLMFGFKDDVVIRVKPDAAGSIVDVRSLSRIGGSDIGTNAKRVRAYIAKLKG